MALTRSQQMARIEGRNTKPEIVLRRALWQRGLRYRLHAPTPVGRPDVVFAGRRVAIFIDGGFWHGCPVHYVRPRSREDFWRSKLAENVERDRRQTLALEELGWRVVRIWEHEVFEALDDVVELVDQALCADVWVPRDDWRVVRVEPIDDGANLERRHLEQLRAPEQKRVIEGKRYTTKWRNPK